MNVRIKGLRTYHLFRLEKTIPTLFGVFTITLHAWGSLDQLFKPGNLSVFALSAAALFFLLCGGYLMNDIFDRGTDVINRPETVYVGTAVSVCTAAVLSAALFAASLVIACIASQKVFAVIALQAAALAVYNVYSKRMAYIKPFFISLLFITIYPLSLAIADWGLPGPRRDSLMIFPVWLFFTTLSYEFASDARDYRGDALHGTRGFTARFGAGTMLRAARILAVMALPIAFIPWVAGMCGYIYLAGPVIAAAALAVSCVNKQINFIAVLHWVVVPVVISSILDAVFAQ